jgi:hypothetical protein
LKCFLSIKDLDYSSDECVAAIRAAAAKMREGGTGE